MNTTTAILKAIDKSGTAGYASIYRTVMTMIGPLAHESVKVAIDALVSEGSIRQLRLGGSAEWMRVQK
jgi:hypothetical protein